MSKILGRATIRVDGRSIQSKRGATLNPGGVQRTAVVGSRAVHGHSEELVACELSVRLTQTSDFTLEDVRSIEDATIVFDGDDGVSYAISGGFSTSIPTLNEVDGEISATFSGLSCDRVG